jgi:hypothetical protein
MTPQSTPTITSPSAVSDVIVPVMRQTFAEEVAAVSKFVIAKAPPEIRQEVTAEGAVKDQVTWVPKEILLG